MHDDYYRYKKLRAAIVGASGYAGTELLRLLLDHPEVKVTALYVSEQSVDAGKQIDEIDGRLCGRTDLKLQPLSDPEAAAENIEIVFLATEHEVSARLAPVFLEKCVKVFDLSGAFRLADPKLYPKHYGFEHAHPELLEDAVYALPEYVDEARLREANLISLPGCYPTASQLVLRPLIDAGLLDLSMPPVIDAVSGVSGAGRKAKLSNAFCEVSLSAYGIFTHRHRPEIEEHLGGVPVIFNPHLGAFKRGILATITAKLAPGADEEAIERVYERAYTEHAFVRVRQGLPKLDDVVNQPYCDIGFKVSDTGYIVIVSAIDNLLKGAASQAVQAMNMRLELPEDTGFSV